MQNQTRVSDIIRRMQEYGSQAEPMKTCLGILAIMSREEANKLVVSRDGMETILNVMTLHVDKSDVQEAGCDLLWSLAFGNSTVKEIIAKYGGASVLVRAVKRHGKSPEFLKSACGALSNICQSKLNQEGVASLGGLQPLVGSIHAHQNNGKLLPFVFDALAALIVGNEDNARMVSSLGFIPLVITSITRHRAAVDIVKSGCHALAILTDVKGQASKIAFAGGVTTILPLLDTHPSYADLHRVSTVVLLRMLQESCHVAREIVTSDGIRILLKSLDKGGALHDTVAAVAHILYTVTSSSQSSTSIEPQLWKSPEQSKFDSQQDVGSRTKKGGGRSGTTHVANIDGSSMFHTTKDNDADGHQTSALNVIVRLLVEYRDRKDVVRASCRLLSNVCEYSGVMVALDKMLVLDKMLECVGKFNETKDIVESTVAVMKSLYKRMNPTINLHSCKAVEGLLGIFRKRLSDESTVMVCCELIANFIKKQHNSINNDSNLDIDSNYEDNAHGMSVNEYISPSGEPFNLEVFNICLSALDDLMAIEKSNGYINASTSNTVNDSVDDHSNGKISNYSNVFKSPIMPRKRPPWSKVALKHLGCIVTLIEALTGLKFIQDNVDTAKTLLGVIQAACASVPLKSSDVGKRLQKLISMVRAWAEPKKEASDRVEGVTFVEDDARNESKSLSLNISDMIDPVGPIDKFSISQTSREEENHGGNKATAPRSPSSQGNRPRREMAFWKIEGPDGQALSPSHYDPKYRLLPNHPCKDPQNCSRLLENWPNYLERMNPPSNLALKPIEFSGNGIPERMSIAYEGASAAGSGLLSKCPNPVPYEVDRNGVGEPFEHSLTFDSEFESGNLMRAVQRGDAAYDLFLRPDIHTPGHTQWFYFAVSNTHPAALVRLSEQGVQVPPVRVRFNIVNLTKPDSLFNLGMRPVMYSCTDAAKKNIGWMRAGTEISYYGNPFQRNNQAGEGVSCYYTLSFTMEFHNPRDTYLVAYSYPYTMQDYRSHIREVVSRKGASDIIRCSQLCTTLGGQDCDLLVITDFKDSREVIGPVTVAETFKDQSEVRRPAFGSGKSASKSPQLKPALFFSGRVHPGESPASWMMKGMIDYLTSNNASAVLLRQLFVIYIVPVLNPDGVYYGNNRCSLAGVDLNRQWKNPVKNLFPTVYTLKSFMSAHRKIREIGMYIDLHGHSRKCNVFMYGADDKKRLKPQVRAFPRFFANNDIAKKYVSYADCSFHVKKGREGTARVIVSKELNIPLSFTLEATFCGPNYGPLKNCHMNTGHLQEVGTSLCDTIFRYVISPEGKSAFYTVTSLSSLSNIESLTSTLNTTNMMVNSSNGVSSSEPTGVDDDSGSESGEGDSENDSVIRGKVGGDNGERNVMKMPMKKQNGFVQSRGSGKGSETMPAIENNGKTLPVSVTRMRLESQHRSLFSKTPSDLSRLYFTEGNNSQTHGNVSRVRKGALMTITDDSSSGAIKQHQAVLSAPSSTERRSAPIRDEGSLGSLLSKRIVRQNSLNALDNHRSSIESGLIGSGLNLDGTKNSSSNSNKKK